MSPLQRALGGLILQAALIAFGIYLGVSEEALPGASTVARAGIAALFVGVAMLLGELAKLRAQFGALLAAIKGGLQAATPRDDRMAIDVLVAALSSSDPAVRSKAHSNLLRLTKQDFPPDAERWKTWWGKARETFPSRGADLLP